jgi:hypothetical protein
MDDPDAAIFRTADPLDTRIMLSLTPYDVCVLTQLISLATFPEKYRSQEGYKQFQVVSTRVGALILTYMDDVWAGMTEDERRIGLNRTVEYPDDAQ